MNSVDKAFVHALTDALSPDVVKGMNDRYLEEPRGRLKGKGGVLVLPRTTEQVSTLLKLAHQYAVPVVPFGGGTGLVAGQVKPCGADPVVLSLERMKGVIAAYPDENAIVVEAGCTLARVQEVAADIDRVFPLSLASEGTAQIGGNLATNAGGVNVLRYGNARDLCLGLECVFADGQIWHGLGRLHKDNTGYDLRNLLIGSEGTLGVITAASLKVFPRPYSKVVALMTVSDPSAAINLLSLAKGQTGDTISAFELIPRQGLEFVAEIMPQAKVPFSTTPEWLVLIEIGLHAEQAAENAVAQLFVTAASEGLVQDAVVSQSVAQQKEFWALRENISEACRLVGSIAAHDVSLPISTIPAFLEQAGDAIRAFGALRVCCFGHLGDGNLHYNVFPEPGRTWQDHADKKDQIINTVNTLVHGMGGSFSAEHGVGRMKTSDLLRYGDPAKVAAIRAIKGALDPKGILNPGVILS